MKSVEAVGDGQEQPRGLNACLLALAAILFILMLLSVGCSSQHPGESIAETNRRHGRVLRQNNQMLMSDLDKVLLLDRPSKLTDKRLP